MILTLTPAYGRDYRSPKEATADWTAGKDFQIADIGPDCDRYISVRDLETLRAEGYRNINIRYKCLSRVCAIKL